MDAPRQAAIRAMSDPAKARYADWREGFERHTDVPPAQTAAERAADLLGSILAAAATPEGFIGFVPASVNTLAGIRDAPSLARELANAVNAVVQSFRNRLGRNPTPSELRAAMPNFSQRTAQPYFGDEGPLAGKSIFETAERLRTGEIGPSQLPLKVITRDGREISMNNRSLVALRQAGIDPSRFTLEDLTGILQSEKDLTGRLLRNRLGPTGTDTIKIQGAGPDASVWKP
ncbi:MAG: hypothetical protein IT562_11210 [Alphaproteobacteria bacterium]|nr:hypothetical protein [Alphaproteobacteria bacterium]